METLYIVIGAFSSIFIFLLGYSVSGVFNGKKSMGDIKSFIEDTNRRVDELDRDVYSHIDSRLDKLETKLKGVIQPINDDLEKRIEKIEESYYTS
jgi:archaellum component FlaC|tara:strand:+ start:354 stop:638 length:285 start_codon:yes stop_codon:yes gene_type:complete